MTKKEVPDAAGKVAKKHKAKSEADARAAQTPSQPTDDDSVREEARRLLAAEQAQIKDADVRNPVLPSMRTNATGCADIVLERFFSKNGFWQIVYYRAEWYVNYKGRWARRTDPSITNYIDDRLRQCRTVDSEGELIDFPVSTGTVAEITNRIQARVTISDELIAPIRRVNDRWVQIDVTGMAVFRNQIVNMLTREVESADGVFYPGGADFNYDPDAAAPLWEEFLDSIFKGMPEERKMLAHWTGYLLSGSTHLQKAMLIEGPPRAGKGVIGNVLTELVGESLCAFPTLQDLSKDFGLQQLLDKKFLLSSDVRLSNRTDSMAIIEKILKVTGGDKLAVGRKHTSAIQTKLGVRIMLLTNSLPRMSDDSEAFFSRFLIIKLKKSFLGNENPELFKNLKPELPGIALWAMDGYRDLVECKTFSEPESSKDARAAWYQSSNPLKQFIEELCKTVPIDKIHPIEKKNCISSDDIYADYTGWAKSQGIEKVLTKNWFIHHFIAELGDKVESGRLSDNARTRVVLGVIRNDEKIPL